MASHKPEELAIGFDTWVKLMGRLRPDLSAVESAVLFAAMDTHEPRGRVSSPLPQAEIAMSVADTLVAWHRASFRLMSSTSCTDTLMSRCSAFRGTRSGGEVNGGIRCGRWWKTSDSTARWTS